MFVAAMDAKVLRTGTNITAIHIVNCSVKWTESTWDEWDAPTMFAALRLRADVFVVEQDCVYPDLDDKGRSVNPFGRFGGKRPTRSTCDGYSANGSAGSVLC